MKHFNCKRWVIDLLSKGGWKLLRGQTQRGFHPIWKVQRKGTFEGRRAWPLSEMKFGHLSSRSTRLQMPAVRYVLQIGTAKGHILPFPLLMKCQAIDPTFSSVLNHTPFDPPPFLPEHMEVLPKPERRRRCAGEGHQGWRADGGRRHR